MKDNTTDTLNSPVSVLRIASRKSSEKLVEKELPGTGTKEERKLTKDQLAEKNKKLPPFCHHNIKPKKFDFY